MEFRTAKMIFLKAKEAKGLSGKSLIGYESSIKNFGKFCLSHDVLDVESVTSNTIEEYLISKKEGNTTLTVFDAYRDLRVWFRWLRKKKYLNACPIDDVEIPKKGHQDTRYFSAKEIKMILSTCDKRTFNGLRDYAILQTLLGTGLRLGELVRLKDDEVSNVIKVFGKGDKYRYVPVPNKLHGILQEYRVARDELFQTNHLFVTHKGFPITHSAVSDIFRRIKKLTGISGNRISCHTILRSRQIIPRLNRVTKGQVTSTH